MHSATDPYRGTECKEENDGSQVEGPLSLQENAVEESDVKMRNTLSDPTKFSRFESLEHPK